MFVRKIKIVEMRRIHLLQIYFILFVGINFSYSYNLRQLGGQNGLSNSSILSIFQDEEGCLWFGTCDGLNYFCGSKVKEYTTGNENEILAGNLVEDILETEKGIFWVHTNYGLNKIDRNNNTVDHFFEFTGKYHLIKNRENLLLIYGPEGVFYYNQTDKTFKTCNLNIPNSSISTMFFSMDNILYVFTKEGNGYLYRMSEEASFVEYSNFEHSSKIRYCFEEKNESDRMYFIDEHYILYEYTFKDRKKSHIKDLQKEIKKNGEVTSIVKLHHDYFLAFKTNGLLRIENTPDQSVKYEVRETEIRTGIFCLLKDRYRDLIWICTDGQGVYLYSNDAYSFKSILLDNSNFNVTKPVRAFFLDSHNNLWVGTKGDGIIKINNYSFEKNIKDYKVENLTTTNSGLYHNSLYAFAPSKRNIIWIGTEEGLNYYNFQENKIERIKIEDDKLKYIHAICEINDSVLWLSTVGNGIIKAHIGGSNNQPYLYNLKHYTIRNGDFASNYFFTAFQDKDSSLLFGNRGYGAFRINNGDKEPICIQYDTVNNPNINDIYTIASDELNNLWFGTAFGLVKQSQDKKVKIYTANNGLPNKSIHGLLRDNKNNIWVSTNNGVIRFDPQKEVAQTYDAVKGLQVMEYSDGAFYKDEKSGILFFGGINGFVCIKSENYSDEEYIPSLHLDDLIIFGKNRNPYQFMQADNCLKLNHRENYFSLTFNAVDYLDESNYNYYYMPEGLSDKWMDNGSSNTVSFTNLNPGKYTLHLKCRNRVTGIESPVYSIGLYIIPPWYLSTLARIAYLLLIGGIMTLLIINFQNRKKRKNLQSLEKAKHQRKEEIYESKLQFFTNIAHEFSTPLTLIYGPCDKISSYKNSDSFIISCTKQIRRNADRLNDLIQEIIEFRRIETENRLPQIQEIDVSELAQGIVELFYDLSDSKKIQFNTSIQPLLKWDTDKGFLTTILTNLLSNSFKYTPNEGEINLVIKKFSENLEITISNTGKGIKENDLSKIFDRYKILSNFETGKTEFSRNGLGLSISYNMIKLLGGEINVESVLNEKTTFSVILPQKEINYQDSELRLPEVHLRKAYWTPERLPEYEFDKSKPSILIVDNDVEMLKLICDIFADTYNVVPVNNPLEVIKILSDFHPDIIISDIIMSDMDGIELAKEIKANNRTSHIPLILISGKQTIEEQINGLNAGAEMYITKPFNIDYLKTSVNKLISRKETLKDYFSSPISAFELSDGKLEHKEDKKFMQKIRKIIEQNISNEDLSPDFIANSLNITSRNLYRKLNELNASSPTLIIKEYRLGFAAKLLIGTKLTINEIIFKSGFSNRGTFFKLFSEKYNCTPKEYREKNKPTEE